MTTKAAMAEKILGEITVNVDAYVRGTLDYETFGAQQRDAWDRADRYGVADAMRALMRGDAADFDRLTAPVA